MHNDERHLKFSKLACNCNSETSFCKLENKREYTIDASKDVITETAAKLVNQWLDEYLIFSSENNNGKSFYVRKCFLNEPCVSLFQFWLGDQRELKINLANYNESDLEKLYKACLVAYYIGIKGSLYNCDFSFKDYSKEDEPTLTYKN